MFISFAQYNKFFHKTIFMAVRVTFDVLEYILTSILRGNRNNHIPCWDAECENLYRTFPQSPQGSNSNGAATELLLRLDKKRRD